ncbi:unnamed protein product [Eretmochelys imbricata]
MVLVANGAEGELEVNPAALEILRGVAQLVVVVAIVGLYHTGFSLGTTIHKAGQDSGAVASRGAACLQDTQLTRLPPSWV